MVKELPKHAVKPKFYVVSIIDPNGNNAPIDKLVRAKTAQGARAHVANALIEVNLADGDTVYRMATEGITPEDASGDPDLYTEPVGEATADGDAPAAPKKKRGK